LYFLDTNICIYALKGTYPGLKAKLEAHNPSEIGIASIVQAELLFGAEKSDSRDKVLQVVTALLAPMTLFAFGDMEAKVYARIRAQTEAKGKSVGPNDLLIAATVMANGGILVTHNTKEFSAIPGIALEDWTRRKA
jgi:tRNA(fMet)-specific endonuclease VapC